MIKRLLLISIILGLGQIFIVLSLKSISSSLSAATFSLFGQIESVFQFLIILMAAGILSDAIRRIGQTPDWQSEYLKYQSARIYFSLLLCPLALLFFINKSFLIFLAAPIIGLSGEYAFYGIGKPVTGALVALVRILIPYGISIYVAKLTPNYFLEVFLLLLFLTYFLSGLAIARLLNTPYLIKPAIKDLRLYLTSLRLGFVNVLLFLQGLGLMIIIPLLFSENYQVISVAFIALKFYAIYRSIIRIIHQSLVREMRRLEECLTVDKLSMILGFSFIAAAMLFPRSTFTLLFGHQFIDAIPFFQLMAASCLVFSFCFSLGTNAVLMNYDKKLLNVCTMSAVFSVVSLIAFSFLLSELYAIGFALLIGEIVLSIGLLSIYHSGAILKERAVVFIQNAFVLVVPISIKFVFFSDTFTGLVVCIFCYSLILLLINLREFNSVKLTKLEY